MAGNDFVDIVGQLTSFVQNERVAAYNEGMEAMIGEVRSWIKLQGHKPNGDNIPDLLEDYAQKVAA